MIYFANVANFELVMYLNDHFNEDIAKKYFDALAKKIKEEDLNEIIFKVTNDFFISEDN
jgi:hypothetical protein